MNAKRKANAQHKQKPKPAPKVPETKREKIEAKVEGQVPPILFADGFDNAILGLCHRYGMSPVVAYDYTAVIKTLVDRDRMTEDEAMEFFEFNIIGAWVGNATPVFIETDVL